MNPKEHIGMAQELMERAEQESRDGGNELVAAEFLWGAFAHCLITVALTRDCPTTATEPFSPSPRTWTPPKAATHGAHASGRPKDCTSTSTTGP